MTAWISSVRLVEPDEDQLVLRAGVRGLVEFTPNSNGWSAELVLTRGSEKKFFKFDTVVPCQLVGTTQGSSIEFNLGADDDVQILLTHRGAVFETKTSTDSLRGFVDEVYEEPESDFAGTDAEDLFDFQ